MIYRVRWKDLAIVECGKRGCRKSRKRFSNALKVVELFRKNHKLGLIRDGDFLRGGFDGKKVVGKRIDVLPDGTELDKEFPLFAPGLMIHDEKSHGHWDVIFQNPSGSFCYVYSKEKMKINRDKKFEMVDRFEACLPKLRRELMLHLGESDLVLAMIILLQTKMRVGGEIYYKRSRHKGLTTLKKGDLKISGSKVLFNFVGKDGVPHEMEENFEDEVIKELRKNLRGKSEKDFVFLNGHGGILRDTDFEKGFLMFCDEKFYPHIVRSHFATREVEKFLEQNRKGARELCLKIASKLGHKKFVDGEWKDDYAVTLHSYVRGDLAERIRAMT